MNNSFLATNSVSLHLEEPVDTSPVFIEREANLLKVIEALRIIRQTNEWSSLKEEVFDKLSGDLERQIGQEAQKLNPDTHKLNRLSGELKWAERFSDLKKLEDSYRVELTHVRSKLYGKTEKDS